MSSDEIRAVGDGFAITITVDRYERLTAQDESDLNWLKCELSARVGVFTGVFELGLTTDELESWGEQLGKLLERGSGEVLLVSEEDNLRLEVVLGLAGRAQLSGRISSQDMARAALEFQAETDRTSLAQLHADLRRIVRDYPTRVSNE